LVCAHPAETVTATAAAGSVVSVQAFYQFVGQALVIALPMVMLDEFVHGASEMALAQRDDPIQPLRFDRSHEALRMRIRVRCPIRRLHDMNPRVLDHLARGPAPFAIA